MKKNNIVEDMTYYDGNEIFLGHRPFDVEILMSFKKFILIRGQFAGGGKG